jgi:hypothetical protein
LHFTKLKFCVNVLDETTYYFSAFALDTNGNILDTQTLSIKTDFWWHVSANTLAYYPLNNTTKWNDMKWFWTLYNLSNLWSTSRWTKWNIECAIFSASTTSWLYNNSVPVPQWKNEWTVSVFVHPTWYNWSEEDVFFIWTWSQNQWFLIYNINPLSISTWGTALESSNNVTLNTWSNIVITQKNWNYNIYLNWTLIKTWTMSNTNISWTRLNIWFAYWNGQSNKAFIWWMAEFIFEKYEWTSSDVTKYYDRAKNHF